LSAAFRFAAYKPAVFQMTSREYESRDFRHRVEIRWMRGQHYIFIVQRKYKTGEQTKYIA